MEKRDWYMDKVSTGTTIMAASYDGGVVLGCDTRTTVGTYVANRGAYKLLPLAKNIYLLQSGSVADTQTIGCIVEAYLGLHEYELEGMPFVKSAGYLVQQQSYVHKEHLSAGMIVAGWDRIEGGAVYSVPMGGSLIKVPFALGGSGARYIYGWCDKNWKPNMTREECQKFVSHAVAHAIGRDGASGGCIRLATVDSSGGENTLITGNELPIAEGDLRSAAMA